MLPNRLLWDPMPDPLPSRAPRRMLRLRAFLATLAPQAAQMAEQEIVDRRVRRGSVQSLVRDAYRATVAEQDTEHRGPDAFAQVWQNHLISLIEETRGDSCGWPPSGIGEADIDLACNIYQLANRGRREAIESAVISRPRCVDRGFSVPTFKSEVVSQGSSLGDVIYAVCPACDIGLLIKIVFEMEWHCCGFGRRSLKHLEARHPDLTWYTTGQDRYAKGFYDRYRQDSSSPWTVKQRPCPHFR